MSGYYPVQFTVLEKTRTTSFRIGLGLEPWRMIASTEAGGRNTSTLLKPGDPNWQPRFHQVNELAEGAQMIFVLSHLDRNWQHRLIALDTNGVERLPLSSKASPIDKSQAWTCTFTGLPLEAISEFRIQVRPIHWVEFKDLALEPKGPLPAPMQIAFGPSTEREITEYIDFDTGQVREMPITGSGLIEGLNEVIPWMERNGIDAAAGNGELQTLGLRVIDLKTEEWDALKPAEVVGRLHRSAYVPRQLKPRPGAGLPLTFAFRTREGATGILQITKFVEDRPGATVRFKLMQRPIAGGPAI